MLVYLDARQELARSRQHEAARRAEQARLDAEAAKTPEPPANPAGGPPGLARVLSGREAEPAIELATAPMR